MTRAQLTDAQHDALRMLVEHARCRDHGLHLGRTTDANLREINGRVARRLAEHGLVEFRVDAEGRFHQVGDEVAHATEAGRAFILEPMDAAWAAMSAPAPPAAGLDDEARVMLEEASRADAVEEDDSCDCWEHDDAHGDDWHVDGCDGGDEEDPVAPSAPAARLFEGIRITSDQLKVKAAAVHGSPDLRHGDEAVVVLVVEVVDVQHPGDEAGVTRTVVAKADHGYLVDGEVGFPFVRILTRQRAQERAGGPTLMDPDDDPEADLHELLDKLNREGLEVRDEDGIREWDDDDLADDRPVEDIVSDLLTVAEADRPQWRVERGTGNANGLWVIVAPDGEPPVEGAYATDGDAIAFVEARTGPLDWHKTAAGAFVADDELEAAR